MVNTQLNGHQIASDEDSSVSVPFRGDPQGKRKRRLSLRQRKKKRLTKQLQGARFFARSAGLVIAYQQPSALSIPLRVAPPPAAIDVHDLSKQFGTLAAVDHLSLRVEQGEIFGLLGPNGSGKTTTINMISGLSRPTRGRVTVMGYDVQHDSLRIHQMLGAVPQETALYDELSAWANMDFYADLFGIPRKEKKERITKMLALVQLLERKDCRVSTYSGGMKRRLALARALLHEPQLIILDEPTLGVDVQSRRAIWDYILAQRDRGTTVLLTTNYLEEAQELCTRIAIIDHGKLVALDTPAHLKQVHGDKVIDIEAMVQTDAATAMIRNLEGVVEVKQEGLHLKISARGGRDDLVPQVIGILSEHGGMRNITTREPNLEEIFLHLTGTALRD